MTVTQYVDAFGHRVRAAAKPGQQIIEEPGIVALLGTSAEALDGRVLVVDDRALDVLSARLPVLSARVVTVFAGAVACQRLMEGQAGYHRETSTAMVCDDLASVPDAQLCDGLTLRPVSREPSPPPQAVHLQDAAAAALRADPGTAPADSLEDFVDYLRSVPRARFVAAVDDDGVVRATAAATCWGDVAGVFFVDTDVAWRGRGIGTAMTAAALREAARSGARSAVLDSSASGLSIYRRLGFRAVGEVTVFVRTSA